MRAISFMLDPNSTFCTTQYYSPCRFHCFFRWNNFLVFSIWNLSSFSSFRFTGYKVLLEELFWERRPSSSLFRICFSVSHIQSLWNQRYENWRRRSRERWWFSLIHLPLLTTMSPRIFCMTASPMKLRWQYLFTHFWDDLAKVLWNSSGMPQKLYGNCNFDLFSSLYWNYMW